MKDVGEVNVILCIKNIRNNDGICLSQSHYIEKIHGMLKYHECFPVATSFGPTYKLTRNSGRPIAQLEYAKVIGCFMCSMTGTRPDIAFAIGNLSRYNSNLSKFHWQAIH